MRYSISKFILITLPLVFSGCSASKIPLENFTYSLQQGNYKYAKKISENRINNKNYRQNLLWNLQSASAERLLQNYSASNKRFDHVEDGFRYFDQQLAINKPLQTSQGILVNDSLLPYTGKNHDRIMVNTYKALNFATQGDKQNARVEFNRALYRQNTAKTLFAAQAQDLKNKLFAEKKRLPPTDKTVELSVENIEIDQIIKEKYKNLDSFKSYADFVNPFTSYIAGLYFWLDGDFPKAVDIMKEAYGFNPKQLTVAKDLKRIINNERPSNELWVIFENGLSARRKETRFDIPVLLSHAPIQYIGAAFPTITPGKEACSHLRISDNEGTSVSTQILSDMDNIIAAEFKEELRAIIAREVLRVALKTYFQYKMQTDYGSLAGIVSGIYQAATTAVDLRTWSALPKNFQVAHVNIPENHKLNISTPKGKPVNINIPADADNVILYIRLVAENLDPVYDFIKF